jgi:magnesium chelatase family protein
MLVRTFGSAVYGVDAVTITVEVNVSEGNGVGYFLVGLPDNAVKESQHRIETALKNNHYKIPRQKVVINMAPADIRKEGSSYDATIAIGYLAASDQLVADNIEKYIIMGELSLDGYLKPIKGALPIAIKARQEGFEGFILPQENAKEAAIVNNLKVYGATHIREIIEFFNGDESHLTRYEIDTRKEFEENLALNEDDFASATIQTILHYKNSSSEYIDKCLEVQAYARDNYDWSKKVHSWVKLLNS